MMGFVIWYIIGFTSFVGGDALINGKINVLTIFLACFAGFLGPMLTFIIALIYVIVKPTVFKTIIWEKKKHGSSD
jgi:hypothetical protein